MMVWLGNVFLALDDIDVPDMEVRVANDFNKFVRLTRMAHFRIGPYYPVEP